MMFASIRNILRSILLKLALVSAAFFAVLVFSSSESMAMLMPPGSGATAQSICTDTAGVPVPGFTVALVYCVKEIINDALSGTNKSSVVNINPGYLTQIINFLTPFKWAAITLAMCLYGVKLVTVSVEELLKESASLLFRIALVYFIIANLNSPGIYSSSTGNGLYAALSDSADEIISFVSSAFATPNNPQLSTCVINGTATLPNGASASVYGVWVAFDCVFQDLMGVASNPAVITGTIVVILGAAIFSGGLAIFALFLGITAFILVLLTLMRAIYVLLLSYFIMALLTVIGPLIIPLRVFDNEFTKEIFWKWLGLIVSTVFQPVFIVAFLSFAVMVEDMFVHGNFVNCKMDTYSNTPKNTVVLGNGHGVCSLAQIIGYCGGNASNCVKREPFFSLNLNISFPNNCNSQCGWPIGNCVGPGCILSCPPCLAANVLGKVVNFAQNLVNLAGGIPFVGPLITGVTNWAESQISNFLNFVAALIFSVPRLHGFPLKEFFVTMSAMLIVTIVLRSLLNSIPELAKKISMGVGLGLLQAAQVPLEGLIVRAVKGAEDNAKYGLQRAQLSGKGGGMFKPSRGFGILKNAAMGAGRSVKNDILK